MVNCKWIIKQLSAPAGKWDRMARLGRVGSRRDGSGRVASDRAGLGRVESRLVLVWGGKN